jgi:Ca-activated chloride channel family protein
MSVNGKTASGELIDAAKARHIYTEIVRRTQDPGLLEYLGQDLLKLQIFPVPPKGDQKVEVTYTSIAKKEHEIVEYVYPLRTDSKAITTLEDFTLTLQLKSPQPILNIYSPTHAVAVQRTGDREATVQFEKSQSVLDRDFQLFYTTSPKDVGLTALMHRPITSEDGYFMLLISPRPDLSKEQHVPRDMVFVLDTSGSMREDGKLDQAKKALQHCLSSLKPQDRFALVNFSTTVNRFRNELISVADDTVAAGKKWIDHLEPMGGTAINEAMANALEMRSSDDSRTFTVVFFTDGKPTIGETNVDKILANVAKKNTSNTRIFTFGVGNDLNAAFLDQVAEQSRALSTYVQPQEDIELKVSTFFTKISHPVLANLKLQALSGVSLAEMYPPQLPDLFHGGQLVVLGRYHGAGATALKLTGNVGKEAKDFVYEMDFQPRANDRPFVEDLWARRKVGYLLEQIRTNGEKKELVDAVTTLAKRYGITTPYTSYLIVPDTAVPVAQAGTNLPEVASTVAPGGTPLALAPATKGGKQRQVEAFAKMVQNSTGEGAQNRAHFEDRRFGAIPDPEKAEGKAKEVLKSLKDAENTRRTYQMAKDNNDRGRWAANSTDKLGVDLAVCMNCLKNQNQLQQTALRRVANRNCMEIGGVWIDEGFDAKTPTVVVKAMSDAYFRILDRQPQVKEVFQLGNHLVWMSPNGTALVIDSSEGKEQLSDAEIDKLFALAK